MIGIREALGMILATTNSPKPPGIFATRQILKKGGNGLKLNIPRLEFSVVWICDKIICDKIITNRGICQSGNILDGNDFDYKT